MCPRVAQETYLLLHGGGEFHYKPKIRSNWTAIAIITLYYIPGQRLRYSARYPKCFSGFDRIPIPAPIQSV